MSLKATGVVRHYAGNPTATLQGLSFDLPEGTLTALLGKSGAGKSTLLRCVMGLEPFEQGTIEIDGVVVKGTKECTPAERHAALAQARTKLGLVFQNFELFPHLTVIDNCTLAMIKVKQLSQTAAKTKAREVLVGLGLEHRIDVWPEQLSGGQKQRVAIARALAVAPQLLILDEPTSALDVSVQARVMDLLVDLGRQLGLTYLFISHDLSLMRNFADTVGVLYLGQIVETGLTAAVFENPQHDYTRLLLASVPVISAEEEAMRPKIPLIDGEIPTAEQLIALRGGAAPVSQRTEK